MKRLTDKDPELNELFKTLRAITIKELKELSQDDLKRLVSVCWKDKNFRCYDIGIHDLRISEHKTYIAINYSTEDGDPTICINNLDYDTVLHNVNYMDRWTYGLYLPK